MATGSVAAFKYSNYTSPYVTEFTKSVSASSSGSTTATDASYPAIPAGYYGVFSGFSTVTSVLLLCLFNANASGSDNLQIMRNVSTSAQNNKSCNFYTSLLQSDLIQDERNL